jgi:hypothetical protein
MGGFQHFEHPDQPAEPGSEENKYPTRGVGRFVRILEFNDVYRHRLETIIPFTTEKEIKDKGKSDGISKFVVLLQTSWFIIQCIARGIKHLPLTELEIVTLAYAMLNFFVYVFWWDKPRGVGCPVRVYEQMSPAGTGRDWGSAPLRVVAKVFGYIVGSQDRHCDLFEKRKVPMFWAGGSTDSTSGNKVSLAAAFGPSILGIAFGAIHCIAWSYVFPSHTELILWRVCSVAMTAVPLVATLSAVSFLAADKNPAKAVEVVVLTVFFIGVALILLSSWLYIAARIATIVMAFTTLRSLPSEAFTVVDWTTFIPHI